MKQSTRVVAILQARTGSTRFPGKVLKELLGEPMLAHIIKRCREARRLDGLVVATTNVAADDGVASVAEAHGTALYRGDEWDVLDRYYRAAVAFHADTIVRLTADDPLVDGPFIDGAVGQYLEAPRCQYMDTTTSGTFPHGMALQIFSYDALASAWREDEDPEGREHVVPYMENHPRKFGNRYLEYTPDLSHLRWTVDYPEDLEYVGRVYGHFGHGRFSWQDAVAAADSHPEWSDTRTDGTRR